MINDQQRSLNNNFNKNAFQQDAYRPLQWPPGWGGGVVCPGGVFPVRAGIHAPAPPPVNRITDAYENITLPQLRCAR